MSKRSRGKSKRIAIIGNSHIAALKAAWDSGAVRLPGWEPVFFGLPNATFDKARLGPDGRFGVAAIAARLDPVEKARALRINDALDTDLSQARAILRVGNDWGLVPLAQVVATHSVPGINDPGLPHRMSGAAFDAICGALAKATLPDPAFLATGVRVVTVLRPVPSENCLQEDSHPYLAPVRQALATSPTLAPAIDALTARIEAVHRENGCIAIAPPTEVRGETGLTQHEFSRASVGLLQNDHGSGDVLHMNGEYGGIVWDMIRDHLKD